MKAFTDTNLATESESNPNQEDSSCEAKNELLHLVVGHGVAINYNGDQFNGGMTSITDDDYRV